MTSRTRARSLPWMIAAALMAVPALAQAQDTPLYRDPSPTDGPKIEGPLLAPRPPMPAPPPPPPGGLGPFQPQDRADVAPESPRDPLLAVTPMPPPMPAYHLAPMMSLEGDVKIRRKTTIRAPAGPLGRFHDWFRDAVFGPPSPPKPASDHGRGFLAWFHHDADFTEVPSRRFNWPVWPLASRP